MVYKHEIPRLAPDGSSSQQYVEEAKVEALAAIAERLELVVEQLERMQGTSVTIRTGGNEQITG